MDTARIAALLQPFLESTHEPCHSKRTQADSADLCHSEPAESDSPDHCHSEPAEAGEEPAVLSAALLQHISTYIDILLRWNARINLTAIRDPEEIVLRHFGESLFAACHLLNPPFSVPAASVGLNAESVVKPLSLVPPESSVIRSFSVADIGSGAGFPGLPMKLWSPHISLTLIESNHKKATFLREVVRSLALTNVNIRNVRAESLSETFDLVTLRAVEDFASILPTAVARVAPGGRLGLLIGSAQIGPARSTLPHLSWDTPAPIPFSTSRMVLAGTRPPESEI